MMSEITIRQPQICRADECGIPEGFADRWTPSRIECARILNPVDSSGSARSSPTINVSEAGAIT